ncbi:MAG: nicotinate (nicotinamide) nucleotide adenylyltransferase [Fusobacteriaceae bacterium]
MKIGIFGGSFNPVHKGHIKIVELVLSKLNLDKIIIIPLGIPALKKIEFENKIHRYNMCVLAFENLIKSKKVEISKIELDENEISYTYDTLMKIKIKYPNDKIYEIIGEDSAIRLHEWKNYKEILRETDIIVINRNENNILNISDNDRIKIEEYKDKLTYINNPYLKYSSTEIRDSLKKQKKISSMVNKEIEKYIYLNKLYV